MIYRLPASDQPVDQGDFIDDCQVLSINEFDARGIDPPRLNVAINRVLILTQTCDLVNQKVSNATVAVIHEAQFMVDQGVLKPADIRGPIRAARVYGWYFLPASLDLGLNEMIVDLRQIHTVRLDLLLALCQRGKRRGRLQSPYREHLARHFADTFSRIGLPDPYETQP